MATWEVLEFKKGHKVFKMTQCLLWVIPFKMNRKGAGAQDAELKALIPLLMLETKPAS